MNSLSFISWAKKLFFPKYPLILVISPDDRGKQNLSVPGFNLQQVGLTLLHCKQIYSLLSCMIRKFVSALAQKVVQMDNSQYFTAIVYNGQNSYSVFFHHIKYSPC